MLPRTWKLPPIFVPELSTGEISRALKLRMVFGPPRK
jgi:hypothetical protein